MAVGSSSCAVTMLTAVLLLFQCAVIVQSSPLRQSGRARPSRHSPSVLYRGDQRGPDVFRRLGGIPPENRGSLTNGSFSMQVHHNGLGKVRSAYTSTTSSFGVSMGFAVQTNGVVGPQGDGWIYEIQPTPNMIDLDASGVQIHWFTEKEYSALGGVRWDQVKAYMFFPKNVTGAPGIPQTVVQDYDDYDVFAAQFPNMQFIKNEQYNEEFDKYGPSGGQPQLAGGVEILEYPQLTLEQWAVDFMNRAGWPAGWKGSFPLDLDAPADLSDDKLSTPVVVPPVLWR